MAAPFPTVFGKTFEQFVAAVGDDLGIQSNTNADQDWHALWTQVATVIAELWANMQALRAASGGSLPVLAVSTAQNPITPSGVDPVVP